MTCSLPFRHNLESSRKLPIKIQPRPKKPMVSLTCVVQWTESWPEISDPSESEFDG